MRESIEKRKRDAPPILQMLAKMFKIPAMSISSISINCLHAVCQPHCVNKKLFIWGANAISYKSLSHSCHSICYSNNKGISVFHNLKQKFNKKLIDNNMTIIYKSFFMLQSNTFSIKNWDKKYCEYWGNYGKMRSIFYVWLLCTGIHVIDNCCAETVWKISQIESRYLLLGGFPGLIDGIFNETLGFVWFLEK